MTDDNNKKDHRPNRSNIPNREGQASRAEGSRDSRDQGRRHGRHRRPHQGGTPRAEKQDGQGNTSSNSNRRHRHNRNRGNNRNPQNQNQNNKNQVPQRARHHLSPEERLVNLYWTHLKEYLQARRAYHAHAFSENESQRIKYKRAYLRALEKWRTWQDGLNDHEKMVLGRRNYEHKLENSYSLKHQITYDRTQIDWTGPFVDQHFLKRQIEADYKGDVEETSGTMEDYQRIKDGYIPAKYRET